MTETSSHEPSEEAGAMWDRSVLGGGEVAQVGPAACPPCCTLATRTSNSLLFGGPCCSLNL